MTGPRTLTAVVIIAAWSLGSAYAQQPETVLSYEIATDGTRWLEAQSGLRIKMLVERETLGGSEVEIGEITFPVGSGATGRGHVHGSVELFYILEGEFEHIVNDVSRVLRPGMVGIVRPGDRVIHRVLSNTPVRALVVWAPGGEARRLEQFFTVRPIERP